ncbi:hypothetical protein [Acetobacter malorum]|uniref:hypothetical protein n=1 Tax=Acetobacter malorum TaxID=178901 RepID=UPI000778003B|nr:hypothetical protein [Acetobacter malorum]KXV05505.1 hypothetical protein AD930_12805 [Acetobacter malorum]
MAKNVAAPKNTAGGGFTFEDQVIAWLLAHMLAAEPLSDRLGMVERLDFQVRVDGWLLDDALVTLTKDGNFTSHLPLSIKSNRQFSKSCAPAEFVIAAWEQFLHEGTTKFEPRTDFLGLACAIIHRSCLNGFSLPADTVTLHPIHHPASRWSVAMTTATTMQNPMTAHFVKFFQDHHDLYKA